MQGPLHSGRVAQARRAEQLLPAAAFSRVETANANIYNKRESDGYTSTRFAPPTLDLLESKSFTRQRIVRCLDLRGVRFQDPIVSQHPVALRLTIS